MRTARLVGRSPDGQSLIVVADDGEELAVAADDRLRDAVRDDRRPPGQRPLGQGETQMDTTLSPREIQVRIRAGQSLEDVARVAGMELDRVERFAAPVLAERDHVALTALAASVRRRGEAPGHHKALRVTVAERLLARGLDADTAEWDSWRGEDGRWTVTADYGEGQHAEFLYDAQGRFSVAGNDEARSLLGEIEESADSDDELALVRATREPADKAGADASAEAEPEPDAEPDADADGEPSTDEANEPTVAMIRRLTAVEVEVDVVTEDEGRSALDTLYEMLGGDGYAEESPRVYAGLSDASAVPVVDEHDFEPPPSSADFPVEPGEDEPTATEPPAARAKPSEEPAAAEQEPLVPGPSAPPKPVRRKRAAVPSWDEIMFGGPKPS